MESGSEAVVRQVIEWACEQGMSIRGLLSLAQLEELKRVFSKERPWGFELYEPLRALSHALPRLELPDLPARVCFADVLAALNELLAAESLPVGLDWTPCHDISSEAFTTLEYSHTSAGISELRSRNRPGWQEHAEHNRAFLLRGAALAADGAIAVIGAGKLYDVPLKQLAERFEHVYLIDVDAASLAESVEAVLGSSPLGTRVELVASDVTGVNSAFVSAARAIWESGFDELGTYHALLALLLSFRSPRAGSLAAPGKLSRPLSACLSSMVLSQLAVPLTEHVERGFSQRFPNSQRLQQREFQVALAQFSHRVQQAHVQALSATGAVLTLTSDIGERPLRLALGRVETSSASFPLIGAPSLEDLISESAGRIALSAEWQWPRVQPTPKRPVGRLLQVNGCAVTPSAR